MSFCIDDDKLLEQSYATWTKVEDFKNIEFMLYQSIITDIYKV